MNSQHPKHQFKIEKPSTTPEGSSLSLLDFTVTFTEDVNTNSREKNNREFNELLKLDGYAQHIIEEAQKPCHFLAAPHNTIP